MRLSGPEATHLARDTGFPGGCRGAEGTECGGADLRGRRLDGYSQPCEVDPDQPEVRSGSPNGGKGDLWFVRTGVSPCSAQPTGACQRPGCDQIRGGGPPRPVGTVPSSGSLATAHRLG